jgi:hypothetical protein
METCYKFRSRSFKGTMESRNNRQGKLLQRALIGAALLALFCALAAGGFWHHDANAQAEAACPVCQVAHMPLTGPVAAPALVVSHAVASAAPDAREIRYSSPSRNRASSRAPPAQA